MLAGRTALALGFGLVITVLLWVPLLNLFLVPLAVCAGTLLYPLAGFRRDPVLKAPTPVVRVNLLPMPRLMRRTFLVLALLGAWALLARDHAPLPLTVGEAVAGPAARPEGSS